MERDYDILRLYRSKNVGIKTFFKILAFFGDCKTAIENIDAFNNKYCKNKESVIIASKEEIDREINSCSTIGAKIITYMSAEYPQILKEIKDFPPILTTLGNIELLKKPSISIVGSRNASSNGCNFAKKIAKELGEKGFVITSGFASGIDSAAHLGALDTGTIAIFGGGIDTIYPKGNEYLYYEIKNKGLLISEFPFNAPPRAENFPSRNRIVSGLSKAVVIIEAGMRSGTIHTARQALEQNRELLVAPGNPYDERCSGCNKLIQEGASVVINCDDILANLGNFDENIKYQNSLCLKDNINTIFGLKEDKDYSFVDAISFQDINANNNTESDDINKNEIDLESLILSKLNYTPIDIEILAADLGININILNAKLVELELEDKVHITNGQVSL